MSEPTHLDVYPVVTLKDRVTGKTVVVADLEVCLWAWTGGSWSCDCNRAEYFNVEHEDFACRSSRFEVIAFTLPYNVRENFPDLSLKDFNEDYE